MEVAQGAYVNEGNPRRYGGLRSGRGGYEGPLLDSTFCLGADVAF